MIVYLGNKLAGKGKNPTSVDTLGQRLRGSYPDLISVSSRKFFVSRLFEMWWTIFSKRNQINFVIIDTYSTLAFHFAWTSAFICRLFRIPYIPIIHGGSFENRINKSKKTVTSYLTHAHQVVTPSSFLYRVIEEKLKLTCLIIPNSIDLSQFASSGKVLYHHAPRIFWLRAYQELYNPLLAIEILQLLRSQYGLDAKLTMVGPDKDGSLSQVKLKVLELNLSDHVVLLEGLPLSKWVQLAKECTVFLNTTTVDNTPVSLIEAMSLGLPIVSSDVGGIPDLITDGREGNLYPSGNAPKAAELIHKLHQTTSAWQLASDFALQKAQTMDWEKSIKPHWKRLLDNYD